MTTPAIAGTHDAADTLAQAYAVLHNQPLEGQYSETGTGSTMMLKQMNDILKSLGMKVSAGFSKIETQLCDLHDIVKVLTDDVNQLKRCRYALL